MSALHQDFTAQFEVANGERLETRTPVLTIRGLRKSYGEKTVLDGIDLDVMPGQILGYIGPNGAGKSTTVKIITGILSDFEGEVRVSGTSVKDDPIRVKSIVGYVPELAELYDLLTPHEYLAFIGDLHGLSADIVEERSKRMLDAFGLSGQLHQRMDSFSKGMRQKVLLVSGLLHNPSIVILDEPLSGLDANAVIVVKELLQRLKAEGKTIFYCSHMMDVVERVSDRIVLLDKGQIVANGTIDELRAGESGASLESIFARLTEAENLSGKAGGIADALGPSR